VFYSLAVETAANTAESSKLETRLVMERGVITKVGVFIPAGHAGLCHGQIYRARHQVWPRNWAGNFAGDDIYIVWEESWPLLYPPYELTIKTWNEDTTYAHTLYFHLVIIPPGLTIPGVEFIPVGGASGQVVIPEEVTPAPETPPETPPEIPEEVPEEVPEEIPETPFPVPEVPEVPEMLPPLPIIFELPAELIETPRVDPSLYRCTGKARTVSQPVSLTITVWVSDGMAPRPGALIYDGTNIYYTDLQGVFSGSFRRGVKTLYITHRGYILQQADLALTGSSCTLGPVVLHPYTVETSDIDIKFLARYGLTPKDLKGINEKWIKQTIAKLSAQLTDDYGPEGVEIMRQLFMVEYRKQQRQRWPFIPVRTG
jgi:hypothetical protein